ncbi:MAG TPA: UDP-3-O-acyl-N-acetylglucosamine deacetylase, partial [Kaistiaceae bacterium]|nr:UDP-3-O-acyl-N-acetylglucosamine deacetylase [Kaistiaceae bacterium]
SSLENSVVLAEDRIVNPEGLRWTDEFVRHKVLDAIGDLALAGAPILGCYRSYRGGHKLNSAMVAALFADPEAWTYETATITRESGHADLSAGVPVPAFGPDVS